MNQLVSFADFAARLKIGDTLTIEGSTYPRSCFRELTGISFTDTRRSARVTRIGKHRIDLLNQDGTKRQISTETIRQQARVGRYELNGKRGSIFLRHHPLVVPNYVTDEPTYRWSHARWGCRVWTYNPSLAKTGISNAVLALDSKIMVYGRSKAEVEHKLKAHESKKTAERLTAALPGFDAADGHHRDQILKNYELGVSAPWTHSAFIMPHAVKAGVEQMFAPMPVAMIKHLTGDVIKNTLRGVANWCVYNGVSFSQLSGEIDKAIKAHTK